MTKEKKAQRYDQIIKTLIPYADSAAQDGFLTPKESANITDEIVEFVADHWIDTETKDTETKELKIILKSYIESGGITIALILLHYDKDNFEYVIAFNLYDDMTWGRGSYYSKDIDSALHDFNKIILEDSMMKKLEAHDFTKEDFYSSFEGVPICITMDSDKIYHLYKMDNFYNRFLVKKTRTLDEIILFFMEDQNDE